MASPWPGEAARFLSVLAAAGFFLTLVGSATTLVPLQRRLIRGSGVDVELMRRRWYRGHLLRTAISLTSLGLIAIATSTSFLVR